MSGTWHLRLVYVVVVFAALIAQSNAQQYVKDAQLEYQRSRLIAYRMEREAQGLLGGALPVGEYSWTMDLRCVTPEACAVAFGAQLLPDGQESFTFVARLRSDGTRMRYSGASVARGAGLVSQDFGCGVQSSDIQASHIPVAPPDPNAGAAGVCMSEESGEAFIRAVPTHPLAALATKPLLWVKPEAPNLLGASGEAFVACRCGAAVGLATPTIAAQDTVYADFYSASGQLPAGVLLTVSLVKVQ